MTRVRRDRQYYEGNKSKIMSVHSKYYKKHKAYIKKYQRKYRAQHAERLKARDRQYNRTLRGRWAKLKSSAKQRGVPLTVTQADFERLIKQPCIYCGGRLPKTSSGIDRKNNSKGYSLKNSVPCCARCNRMKNKFLSFDEMMLIMMRRKGKWKIKVTIA